MVPEAEYLAQLPRKRVITSALIVDAGRRILCLEPTYKPTWHLPGGTVEQGESPSEACGRECTEELGVAVGVGRLLAVSHVPPVGEDPDGALAFIYHCTMPGDQASPLRLPPEEIRSAAWLDKNSRSTLLSDLASSFVSAGLEAIRMQSVVEVDRQSR